MATAEPTTQPGAAAVANAAAGSPAAARDKRAEPVLEITRYDRVVSWLLSILLTVGIITLALGLIWGANQQWFVEREPKPVELVEIIEDVAGGGSEEGVLDESLYQPGPEGPEPSTAADFSEQVISESPQFEQTLTSVLAFVDTALQSSEQLVMTTDVGTSTLPVGSKGKGKHRNLGKGPGDGGGVKREERWEILFAEGGSETEYARQLDYFRVELGAVVNGELFLVSRLATARPTVVKSTDWANDKRLYFSWRGGNRRQTDLNLLRKAGVPMEGNVIVLHFYPFETEQLLARIERDYARDKSDGRAFKDGKLRLELLRKTRFNVVSQGAAYTFEVARQDYFRQSG